MAWEPGLREKREAGGAQARYTKGTGLWRAPVQNRHSVPCPGSGWGALVQGFLATSPSAHPEPPSRPTCVQTEEPSRVGTDELPVAATALCSHAPGRQGARRLPSPARAPLQGRRGRPVSPAPISRAFRSSSDLSAPRLCSGRPPRPWARAFTWAVSAWHRACRPPRRARSW